MFIRLCEEYSLLVFIAVIGVLQLVAARNNLRGLSFFKRKGHCYLFGAVIIVFSLSAFFTWNSRNATGIVQGSEQAGLFALAMFIAVIFTLALGSLVNRSRLGQKESPPEGLDALKELTYIQALKHLFRRRD
jgi:hypothetical protein